MTFHAVRKNSRAIEFASQKRAAATADHHSFQPRDKARSLSETTELNQLIALFNARRFPELESRARNVVVHYPNSGLAWKLLATALQMQGKNALPALQKTATLMPGDAEAHFKLGAAFFQLGRAADAVDCYRRVAELRPESAEAHNNLGAILFERGNVVEAVKSARRAVQLKPEFAEAHNNLGTFLKELGQFDEALASYKEAAKLNPNSYKTFGNLGNLYKDIGDLDAALASYRRALEIKPDLDEAYSNMLFVYNHSTRYSPEFCLEQARKFGKLLFDRASGAIQQMAM